MAPGMVTGHGRVERMVRVWLPVGFFMLLALFPFYWMAITSVKPNAELYNRNMMPLLVHNPTLKHYVGLLTETSFLLWTWNTLLVAVVSTAISLVFGTMLAYPLARMRFAGAGLIAMTVAAIYLVPQPLLFLPFCAWLLIGYFKTVPKELEEAARIDGASRLQTMRRIFLPLCTPGFISAGIFAFTLSQNEFLYALIFLTKSSVRTVPVGVIAELIRGDVFYWGQLMAGALLGSIPVALIYSFFVEHYVAGLTSGSVKA
jgi:multiple sugar transport system permease protein